MELGTDFICKSELHNWFELQTFMEPLPNFYATNKNPLLMLGNGKMHVNLERVKILLELIVWRTFAAILITGNKFCNQYVRKVLPKE